MLATMIVVARILSPEEIGLITLSVLYIQFLDNFVDAGFLHAIIQAPEMNDRILDSCFWFLMALALIACTLTWVLAPVAASLFNEVELIPLIRFLGLTLFALPAQVVAIGLLSREMRIDRISQVEFVAGASRVVISIGLAILGWGVWSLLLGYFIFRLILGVLTLTLSRWRPRLNYSFDHVRPIIDFGLKITVSRILWFLKSRVDTIIVGRLLGTELVGIYSIGRQLVEQATNFFLLLYNRVIFPLFSLYHRKESGLDSIFLKVVQIIAVLAFPAMLMAAATAEPIIDFVFGPQWIDASIVLWAMALSGGFLILNPLSSLVVNAIGRPGLTIWLNLFHLVILTIGFYTGIKLHGFVGAAMAWCLTIPLGFFVMQYFVSIHVPSVSFDGLLRRILVPLAFGSFLYFIVRCTDSFLIGIGPFWRISVLSGAAAIVYSVFLFLWYRLPIMELYTVLRNHR